MKLLLFTQCGWVICLFLGIIFDSCILITLMVVFVVASLAIAINAAFEGQDNGRPNH